MQSGADGISDDGTSNANRVQFSCTRAMVDEKELLEHTPSVKELTMPAPSQGEWSLPTSLTCLHHVCLREGVLPTMWPATMRSLALMAMNLSVGWSVPSSLTSLSVRESYTSWMDLTSAPSLHELILEYYDGGMRTNMAKGSLLALERAMLRWPHGNDSLPLFLLAMGTQLRTLSLDVPKSIMPFSLPSNHWPHLTRLELLELPAIGDCCELLYALRDACPQLEWLIMILPLELDRVKEVLRALLEWHRVPPCLLIALPNIAALVVVEDGDDRDVQPISFTSINYTCKTDEKLYYGSK